MTDPGRPSDAELRAYCAGSLPQPRFEAIDRWLATLPETEAGDLLAQAASTDKPALAGLHLTAPSTPGFVSDLPRGRLRPGLALGEGGMATVTAAHDRVLDRVVAVKVLRPRRPDEPLEHYHLREAAFRREAALTAGLEHPAIPPVYDVGQADGLPAFAMKKLDGRTFEAIVRSGEHSLADLMAILLRVAEAVGYANSRGLVHRDLTPQNILLAEFGAVYVLDWGLAAEQGSQDGIRAGTPAWMAPEQFQASPTDPRMDVFALGGLVFFALTGHSPRPDASTPARLDLRPLDGHAVPRGIAALARRCLDAEAARRYPDAGAVAEDLRHWFTIGVTLAQEAKAWELAWLHLRRSPRIRSLAAAVLVGATIAGGAWGLTAWRSRAEAVARLEQIVAGTALDRAGTVAVALDEVRGIVLRHPRLEAAHAVQARLQTAYDLATQREHGDAVRARLAGLLERTRTFGPWADQVVAWREAIREAGLSLDPARVADDVRALQAGPLSTALAEALAFLWRAEKERGADHHAQLTAQLLAAVGPTPAWQALGRLLEQSRFAAHDPIFCVCADSAATLTEAQPTAIALALFAPEPRLATAARAALQLRPGDFWPLIASARASLADGDEHTAEHLALVASGVEPGSLLPPLLLGYVALQRQDAPGLDQAVAQGLAIEPSNSEFLVLQAVSLAWSGRTDAAQAVISRLDAGHLQYHLHHAVGHPMERSVQALIAAGLKLPDAPDGLGPLVPGGHTGH